MLHGSLRRCKFLRIVDATHVELRWNRTPDQSYTMDFVFDLVGMAPHITEWSIYGFDDL